MTWRSMHSDTGSFHWCHADIVCSITIQYIHGLLLYNAYMGLLEYYYYYMVLLYNAYMVSYYTMHTWVSWSITITIQCIHGITIQCMHGITIQCIHGITIQCIHGITIQCIHGLLETHYGIYAVFIVVWDGALWFWSVIKTIMTDWLQYLCRSRAFRVGTVFILPNTGCREVTKVYVYIYMYVYVCRICVVWHEHVYMCL